MGDTSEGNEILSVLELRPGQVPPALPLPPWVAALTLPVVPEGVTWKQLRLKVRTEKRVRKLASTPQELHRLTVGDLMGQYGFGWASLFDLLYSLRRAGAVGDGCSPGEQVGHRPETPSIQTEVPPAWSLHGPSPMLARKLPVAPEGATWPDLGLRALTERRLQRVAATPQELSRWTIGQLFRLVGKKSTFELLTALQHVGATAATAEGASRGAKSWDVLRLARQIQRSSDAARIHWDDHRFGTLIRAVDAHAQTAAEVGASLGDGMPVDAPAEKLVPMLSKLVHAIRRSRQIPLEEELAELLLAEPSQRRRDMVALYLGWDGGGGTTLAQVGRKYGLTRERVRQICACLLERLKAVRVFAPVLDQVVDFVERHTPLPAAEMESKLNAAGYTKGHFRLEGVITAAEHLGRRVQFVVGNDASRWVALPRDPCSGIVPRVARRSVRRWGAATIADTSSQVGQTAPRLSDEALVARILGAEADFRWLDEARGWFWFYDPLENSLFTRIRKVLSVAPRVSPSELRAAISRDRRMRGFAPPKAVLLELCRPVPWCRTEDDSFVVADPPLSRGQVLSRNEALIAQVLEAHGGVVEGLELERLCVGYGMSESTFWALASGSAIVTRYAPGMYGLVGAPLEPGLLGQRAPIRHKGRVVVDYGWLSDRTIWVAYCLSGGMIRNGVFSLPAAMSRFLQGEYSLHAYDGAPIANVTVRGTSGWSLSALYHRRGGEAGDSLVLVFNSASRQATAYLGQPELIDEFRSGGEVPAQGKRLDGA